MIVSQTYLDANISKLLDSSGSKLSSQNLAYAGLPVTKQPHGLTRSGGKRPDGITMVKEDKPLTWDMTVVCPFACWYIDALATDAV